MAQFNIYLLASHRSRVIEIQAHFLKKISDENKKKIKVFLMCTGHGNLNGDTEAIYYDYCKQLCEAGIECEIVVITGPRNYLQKIEFAQKQESEYSVKLDEDLWFNENVWNYMIDKAPEALANPFNLALTPILSNGIPSCDMFLYDFMTEDQRKEINSMIVETHIPNMWGANYEHLNNATRLANGTWDHVRYFDLVREIKHHYKGIHPVRINFELNKKINDIILDNWDKLVHVPYEKLYLKETKHPYLCNSVFLIRTDTWRNIINNQSLYRDDFDEVPLNLYREQNDLNWVFVRNGYCIHMIYNTVSQFDYEESLTTKCLELIRKEA